MPIPRHGGSRFALTRTIIAGGLKVAIVPDEYDQALLNQRVASVLPDTTKITTSFLFSYMLTQKVVDYVRERVNTLMQPNLSIKDLRCIPVPLPPISEQNRITDQLSCLREEIQELEAIYRQKLADLASLPAGAPHISWSTISVALSEKLEAAHAKAGQRFVAAPVFGRPDVAAAGQLFIIAAGRRDTLDAVAPLFDAIGQKTFVVSGTPKSANLVKLSGNFLIASVIESLGEAMSLVGKGGVDRRQYLDILTSTLFDAPVYKTYGGLIADGTFEPAGFAAPLGYKDIRLTLAAAEDLRVPLPLASLLRDRFLTLLAHGGDKLDWSAIGQLAAKDAGEVEV
jgi:3-hydroxyisobutyrate dehydrogenase-like beta-hydroxyacid dehydrogenase